MTMVSRDIRRAGVWGGSVDMILTSRLQGLTVDSTNFSSASGACDRTLTPMVNPSTFADAKVDVADSSVTPPAPYIEDIVTFFVNPSSVGPEIVRIKNGALPI